MIGQIERGEVRFISRNGHDWSERLRPLIEPVVRLPVETAMLDGEVVVMQSDGTTSFQALQNAFQTADVKRLSYVVLDLLHLNGFDLRAAPLEDRKSLLQELIGAKPGGAVRYSEHVVGGGPALFAEAARRRLEGIVSKRRDRPYVAGRGLDWLKVKCAHRDEFVIGGFTAPTGARSHFGALLLGYYDDRRQLIYAGRVGTGFDQRTLAQLFAKFKPLVQRKSPFADLSGNTGAARGVTWLKPMLVAQVNFSNWTDARQLRHPTFQGLREDIAAKNVVRAMAISPPSADKPAFGGNLHSRATGDH